MEWLGLKVLQADIQNRAVKEAERAAKFRHF